MLVHNVIKKMINFGRIFNLKTSSRNENQLDNSIMLICLYIIILSCVFPVLYTSLTQMCTHIRNSAILPARYFSQYIIYFFQNRILFRTPHFSQILTTVFLNFEMRHCFIYILFQDRRSREII